MNDPLELRLKDEGEIVLPDWIAVCNLTLAEIGAVVCMATVPTRAGGYEDLLAIRMSSDETHAALTTLQQKGVLVAQKSEGKVSLNIELDVVAPE